MKKARSFKPPQVQCVRYIFSVVKTHGEFDVLVHYDLSDGSTRLERLVIGQKTKDEALDLLEIFNYYVGAALNDPIVGRPCTKLVVEQGVSSLLDIKFESLIYKGERQMCVFPAGSTVNGQLSPPDAKRFMNFLHRKAA